MNTYITFPVWPQAITWLIVVVGWIIVHVTSLYRERRREKREAVLEVISSLDKLQEAAIAFHSNAKFEEHQCAEMAQKTERVILTLLRHPFVELGLDPSYFKGLRQSITLRNTDKSTFSSQAAYSEILRDIRNSVDDLIDTIEEAKNIKWT